MIIANLNGKQERTNKGVWEMSGKLLKTNLHSAPEISKYTNSSFEKLKYLQDQCSNRQMKYFSGDVDMLKKNKNRTSKAISPCFPKKHTQNNKNSG